MNVRHKKSSLGFLPRVHVPLVQQEELMPCGYEATRFLWKSHWRTWIGSLIGGHELKVSKVYSFRTQVYSTEVSLNFAIDTSQSILKVCSPLHSTHCLCLRCSSATPVNQLLIKGVKITLKIERTQGEPIFLQLIQYLRLARDYFRAVLKAGLPIWSAKGNEGIKGT